MLKATQELIDARAGGVAGGWLRARELVRIAGRFGGRDDADALTTLFLRDPAGNDHVLPVIERRGDAQMARRLHDATTDDAGLLPGMPAELLRTFGYLGLAETRAMLWGYARHDSAWRSDNAHGTSTAAAYGLLHLPCEGIADEIAAEIRNCVGRNVFPEFLPALASRSGRPELLDTIWQIAESASTDCNGGLLLGMALFGERGIARFHEAMWSRDWEASSGSTGSVRALFAGTCVLGIRMNEITAEWKRRIAAGDAPLHGVTVIEGLLDVRLHTWHTGLAFAPAPLDTMADVHAALYTSSGPLAGDSFVALARQALDRDGYAFTEELVGRVEVLEEAVLARMTEDDLHLEWEARSQAASFRTRGSAAAR